MAAHVLRLRLDLLFGALRGDARHVTRMVLGFLAVVAAVVGVFLGAGRLADASVEAAYVVTVIGGSAITLGFFVAALVGGFDDQLDPRRFALFGISPAQTAVATGLASLVSVPALAAAAVGVAIARLWISLGAPAALVVLSVVLGVLTALLGAKVALAVSALVLRDRRSRELSGLFLVAVLVIVVPIAVFLVSLEWDGAVPSALREAVDVLALTPVGAAWAIPGAGLVGSGTGPTLVGVGTLAVLGGAWFGLVRVLLTTTERPTSGRERAGLGWFAVTPSTPGGAVAARSLIYWTRDARYIVNVVIVPVAAAIIVVPLLVVGVPLEYVALIPAPLMALFLGWLPHNDLAYDSTALWMHIASAARGAADRAGRLVPILLFGIPALAVAVPLLVSLHGRWAILPAMAGVCVSLFLCGLGLSSLASVIRPYPVSRPGDSPFQQPQRTSGGVTQAVVLIGAVLLSAPVLWWGWLTLGGDLEAAWTALWGGVGIGLVVLLAGIFGGGAVFDRSGGRLMEFAESV